MPIFIYNSLTKKKELFEPLTPPKINIYTCGVTVYDECHIGHARSLYIFDVIKSYLKHRGFDVKFVRNITDVDDKIINRARELKIGWQELAEKYIARYYEDLEDLGIKKADFEPRATENIMPMIRHIEALIEKGYAYVTPTGVYFNVRKFKDYGKLSGQGIDQMLVGVRKEADETKEDPLDFAVWKASKSDEPSWDSPWGKGRPGWHIECSVMSTKYLKTDTLDIHAGGRDLIFPHHENEIAQAEALSEKPFAKYWIHHGLLTINSQKMAKSLGNFITVKDFLMEYPADVLKLFFLHTHYTQTIDFNWDTIKEKQKALYRIITFLKFVRKREDGGAFPLKTELKEKISPKELMKRVELARLDFEKAMDDDFNTANAVAALFEIVRAGDHVLYDVSYTEKHLPALKYAKETLKEFGGIFGLSFKEEASALPEDEIKMLIATRDKLKKEKLFKEADSIREQLETRGIILEDTKKGTIWRRKL